MASVNRVLLQGIVDDMPSIRYFSYELVRTEVSLQTEEIIRTTQGEQKQSLWHHVVAWGEVAKYLGQHILPGDEIKVLGRIQYRRETDRTGISKLITEIEATSIELIARHEQPKLQATAPQETETYDLPWEDYAPTKDEDPMA